MSFTLARTAATWLAQDLDLPIPKTALVLGSGLEAAISQADVLHRLPYTQIPGFPIPTAPSHRGEVLLAQWGATSIWILSGRYHLYEGHTPHDVVLPLRTLGCMGVRRVILTNAAGALNPNFAVPSLMLITDHINLTGKNPLVGPNDDTVGPRFPDMSQVYCPQLQKLARTTALQEGIALERGVYAGILGPSLETPAETRMFRLLGADAIGMSTVLEAIAARHLGMDILGISCLTNANRPDCMEPTSLEVILDQAQRAAATLGHLLCALLPHLEKI
jgi:purine-nucleoside phosphorylase